MLAAILTGGASRRMGEDKAFVEIDGVAMVRRVADAASTVCDRVVAIGGDRERLGSLGIEWLPDRWPGEGPLGGLLTALAEGDDVLLLACDMPWVDARALQMAVDALADHDAAVPVTDRPEPLHAAYSRASADVLTDRFASGERSMQAAIRDLADVVWVTLPADLLPSITNVNSARDLPAP
jgi:molybdenum cofactor guanylyltransferase